MVRDIFFRWPHLKKQLFLENDALTLWKEKLRTYLKTSRKRAPDVPEIMAKKNKNLILMMSTKEK